MSLIKQLVKLNSIKQMQESAAAGATSAGAIAGFRAPLLSKKKMRRRAMPSVGVSEEQEETTAEFFARMKKESEARRAKREEERGYDSRSSGRLSSRFSSARDRINRPARTFSISTEQEEKVDWNKEVDEFNKRRRDPANQDRSRKSRFRTRRSNRDTASPMSLRFEQEEKREQKVDWNKELADFRERDAKSTPRRRKSRFGASRRMSGPTGAVFGLRFESMDVGGGQSFEDLVNHYRGILEQDGWETLELTLYKDHPPEVAEQIMHALGSVTEAVGNEKFDPADVISKLRSAEEKADNEENTRGFALEDEDGNIVKVYVAAEEAEEFEQALGAALAGEDEDDDEENTSLEIAEVLFNLKDRFTIVDVEWPDVEEDQEDMATDAADVGDADAETDLNDDLEGDTGDAEGADLDVDLACGEGELNADLDAETSPPGEGGEMSALQSMIDLLKAQADAAKAEAQAREAEANAEEAKYNAQAAESKVKQEEEVLDMEAYYDKKSSADKEAKKLAKLAKWKHEVAQESTSPIADEEQQEVYGALDGDEIPGNKFEEPGPDENRNQRMEPGEFIKYMLMNARRNP